MMDKKSLHTQYRILCTIVIISLPTQGALHVVHLKMKTNVADNGYEIVWKKLSTYENFIILFTYFFNNITDRRSVGEPEINTFSTRQMRQSVAEEQKSSKFWGYRGSMFS